MSRFLKAALCYALLATATLSFAQTLGDISGEVKDPSGAILPGVTVTITNAATNASRSTVSNDSGLYTFPALQPGLYNITAELKGFKKYSQNGIELQVQANLRLDIPMSVGDVSEILEVTAQGAQLATENATVGTVVEQKRIVELPINGRNYLSLAGLAPNVSAGFPSAGQADGRQGGDRANQNISVAGMRNQFNRFTLDGVENTDPNFNTYV
ncbi:MAG: carboxypeptidase regulatory-like domain-containing protein, partial [Acidobacteria bacterium]|nr:carboxypeptidase regulatory-like domain-containing protein [Acidobacteriota bacterium]